MLRYAAIIIYTWPTIIQCIILLISNVDRKVIVSIYIDAYYYRYSVFLSCKCK